MRSRQTKVLYSKYIRKLLTIQRESNVPRLRQGVAHHNFCTQQFVTRVLSLCCGTKRKSPRPHGRPVEKMDIP